MLSQKNYNFTWNEILHKTAVHVRIPDLNNHEYTCTGDWGPNYEFQLHPTESVSIVYTDVVTGKREEVVLDRQTVSIESPMLAEVRKYYPHYYLIKDTNNNICMNLYVDDQFDLKKVTLKRLEDNVVLTTIEV